MPVAFLGRDELAAYLRELLDAEYPVAQARGRRAPAARLRPPAARAPTCGRCGRALLEDNVAGFYDERPGRRRLYAVSEDRAFTPMNQIVLAHELRHALQDQYEDLTAQLADDVTDFDDRRIAWMSLLEGDATLVMERFVQAAAGRCSGSATRGRRQRTSGRRRRSARPGLLDLPGAPPVIRDHLVQPYLVGPRPGPGDLGPWRSRRDARRPGRRPPDSTEQVLHPEKFFDARGAAAA